MDGAGPGATTDAAPPPPASRWPLLLALGVVGVGLALRVLGMKSGLPFIYDPDEPDFVERAFHMFETGDMNPRWFGHPGSTTMYSFWLVFSGYAASSARSAADLAASFRSDPADFYFLSRAVVVAFGAGTVGLTWLLARRVVGAWFALFAAALLAVAPLHVEYSRLARPDIQMAFLTLAAAWFIISIAGRGWWRDYLGAGFLVGLAVATKYPAVVFAAVIVLAHGMRRRERKVPLWTDSSRLAAAALATLAGAFAGSPYLFLSLPTAFANIATEARSYHLSATSHGFLNSLGWYAAHPLLTEVGFVGMALAALGAWRVIRTRDRAGALLLVSLAVFIVFISTLSLRWARWVLPAVPFLCALAAIGLVQVFAWVSRVSSRWVAAGVATAIAAVAVAGPAWTSVPWTMAAARHDSRDIAWRWIMTNVPDGSRILVEAYTPQLPPDRYRLYTVTDGQIWRLESRGRRFAVPRGVIGELFDASTVQRAGIDYVVVANHYDRRVLEHSRYAREIGVYEEIFNRGALVFETGPGPGVAVGVPVRIFRVRR